MRDARQWLLKPLIYGNRMSAAQREAVNEGLKQGVRPYPIVWTCQHCCDKTPGPDGVVHCEDNIGDDDAFILEADDDCGLTFAFHVRCVEIADAQMELAGYEERGGLLN